MIDYNSSVGVHIGNKILRFQWLDQTFLCCIFLNTHRTYVGKKTPNVILNDYLVASPDLFDRAYT